MVAVREHEDALRVLQASKLLDSYGEIAEDLSLIHNVVVQNVCCKRAFIRGPSFRRVPSVIRKSSTILRSPVHPCGRQSSFRG